jgi:hypothetical protein
VAQKKYCPKPYEFQQSLQLNSDKKHIKAWFKNNTCQIADDTKKVTGT